MKKQKIREHEIELLKHEMSKIMFKINMLGNVKKLTYALQARRRHLEHRMKRINQFWNRLR